MRLRLPSRAPRLRSWLIVLCLCLIPAAHAQSDGSATSTTGAWDISDLLDRLPNISPIGKFSEAGVSIRFYARPHLGDFFHRDYIRIPVGAKAKLTDEFELHAELESYFTHGFGDNAGNGLSRARFGEKYEKIITILHPVGWSTGVDFDTPLSRPPMELTDGHRHLLPYFAASEMLVPSYNLVGYASVTLDFLSHTALPANFGRNQLHGDSVTFSTGITRDYKRFRVALTGTWGTMAVLSNENKNVFALRPDILIPLTMKPYRTSRTHLLLIVGGRAVHGPDGTELGVSGSLRVEFAVQPGKK